MPCVRLRTPTMNKEHATDRHLWETRLFLESVFLLVMVILLWAVYVLGEIFLPVFLALVLADVFNPAITYVETHWSLPRPITISLLLTVLFIGLLAFLVWLGPLLFDQFTQLIVKLPDYLTALGAHYNLDISAMAEKAQNWFQTFGREPQKVLGNIFSTTGRALGLLTSALGIIVSISISLLLVAISFFFFAWHFNRGLEKLQNYLPQTKRDRICEIAAQMDKAVGDFFRGRLVIAIIVGLFLSGGWFLTAVPYWFLLGMITGLLNIFPYLAVIGWPAAIILKYADTLGAGQSADLLSIVAWPSVVYLIVQFLDGWILTPWIQSGETNLNAATIIIVVFIGGAVAGMWGLLFAIPAAACVKILLHEVAFPPLKRWADTH